MSLRKEREIARKNLNKLIEDPSKVLFVHYSQSRTYDDDYGNISPIITSIVIKSLDQQIDKQYAIHFEADKADIPIDQIQDSYRDLELRILKSFNEFVRRNNSCIWVHWDMKNIHFGFEAIKHRYEKIFESLADYCEIPSNQKYNVRAILEGMYGDNFVNGPDHFKNLMLCNSNNIIPKEYLTKDSESSEFENKNFDLVIQSVDTKVDFIKLIVRKLSSKKLLVNSKNSYAIFIDVVNNPLIVFIGWLATVIGFGLTIYAIFAPVN